MMIPPLIGMTVYEQASHIYREAVKEAEREHKELDLALFTEWFKPPKDPVHNSEWPGAALAFVVENFDAMNSVAAITSAVVETYRSTAAIETENHIKLTFPTEYKQLGPVLVRDIIASIAVRIDAAQFNQIKRAMTNKHPLLDKAYLGSNGSNLHDPRLRFPRPYELVMINAMSRDTVCNIFHIEEDRKDACYALFSTLLSGRCGIVLSRTSIVEPVDPEKMKYNSPIGVKLTIALIGALPAEQMEKIPTVVRKITETERHRVYDWRLNTPTDYVIELSYTFDNIYQETPVTLCVTASSAGEPEGWFVTFDGLVFYFDRFTGYCIVAGSNELIERTTAMKMAKPINFNGGFLSQQQFGTPHGMSLYTNDGVTPIGNPQ